MLTGTREGWLRRLQPVSIHGQLRCDAFFTTVDEPDGQLHLARLGPEAIEGNPEPGDRIRVDYVVGVAVRLVRVPTA